MTSYLDTSVVVAALTQEAKSDLVRAWMEKTAVAFAISEWNITEVSSALSIKVRAGFLTATQRQASLTLFERFRRESFETFPVAASMFEAAARMSNNHELKLRAGDALHLAVCAHYRIDLCTLVRKQAKAGSEIGLKTILL